MTYLPSNNELGRYIDMSGYDNIVREEAPLEEKLILQRKIAYDGHKPIYLTIQIKVDTSSIRAEVTAGLATTRFVCFDTSILGVHLEHEKTWDTIFLHLKEKLEAFGTNVAEMVILEPSPQDSLGGTNENS